MQVMLNTPDDIPQEIVNKNPDFIDVLTGFYVIFFRIFV